MPTPNYPRTNELGFIDFFLENLTGMTTFKACDGVQSQFQMIHDELSLLRHLLGQIDEVRHEQKEPQALWDAGVKVAYRVESLIDQFVLGDFQSSSSTSFDSSIEDILEEIKSINSEIHRASDIKVEKVSMTSNLVPSSSVPITDEIVGFEDYRTSIINLLKRGSKKLKMVAIAGMPGIGKTTLATKVYTDPSVTFYFHTHAWCCVSQLFDRKKVLLELLNHIDPNPTGNSELAEQNLSEKLWRSLKRKRYLIFLDDVWDIEVWNCLQASFPDDSYGSRVILTSRLRDVAPQAMLIEEPLFVRQLTLDESLELLQRKLFPGTGWPEALYELGKEVAEKCRGLPLTVVVVAGLLATLELQGWKNVLSSLSSGIISSTEQCMNTLELSYRHLPEYLKPCFLYLGLFPEGQEVSIQRLIWLWMAEGFVRKSELRSLEDVARDYMMDLVGRSLVIVAKKRSKGGIKACRIHDLLLAFCRIKAKEENFFQLLKGHDEVLSINETGYLRRLCIHSESMHFKNLRLFHPQVHSLLFFPHDEAGEYGNDVSFIIPRYKHLRVLDTTQYLLSSGIPTKIELFVQLKYLALAVKGYKDNIPSCVGYLSNLETFILVSPHEIVTLPATFWNLQKLRHVAIPYLFHFPIENLENSPDLCELESCSGVEIDPRGSIGMLMRKFPNIRKLKFGWLVEYGDRISIPSFLSRLESLHVLPMLSDASGAWGFRIKFDFAETLRKLDLEAFQLDQSDISMIGKLPNLEVLKLERVDFDGDTWEMEEVEFSELRFLKLDGSSIVSWTSSDDQFPCLQKLVLIACANLEEIPCCFENTETLETIEVSHCCDLVNGFFKRIQDEQMELGNSVLKIHISH